MDTQRLSAAITTFAARVGSRREALLGAAVLALTGAAPTPARRKARTSRQTRAVGLATTYKCLKGTSVGTSAGQHFRFAQTFTASRSGDLREIQVRIIKERAGGAGNYVVQLLTAPGGVPDHSPLRVIAATMIQDGQVPFGTSTLVARFAGTRITNGGNYAAAISRLGNAELKVPISADGPCANGVFFSALDDQPFTTASDDDMIVAVLVAA
jgi:hypothetical protein